jgi:ribose transport system permease protein
MSLFQKATNFTRVGLGRMKAEGALAPALAFAVFFATFVAVNPALLTRFQLQTTMNLVVPLALATLAQMLVIIVGGIDISIGATLSLVNVVFAISTFIMPIPYAMALGLLTGLAAGLFNGFLVAYGRLPAIAVTLATFFIFGALTRELMDRPGGNISYGFYLATSGELIPYVPVALFWLVLIGLGLWWITQRTTLGRHMYAVGSNQAGLEAAGVNSRRTVLIAFGLAGLLTALAAIMLAGSTLTGDPRSGDSYLLNSIAAVALAGVSFAGGRGSILGAVLAAFTLGLIGNFLYFAGINSAWQFIVAALILFSVVAIPAIVTTLRVRVRGVRG